MKKIFNFSFNSLDYNFSNIKPFLELEIGNDVSIHDSIHFKDISISIQNCFHDTGEFKDIIWQYLPSEIFVRFENSISSNFYYIGNSQFFTKLELIDVFKTSTLSKQHDLANYELYQYKSEFLPTCNVGTGGKITLSFWGKNKINANIIPTTDAMRKVKSIFHSLKEENMQLIDIYSKFEGDVETEKTYWTLNAGFNIDLCLEIK